MSVQSEIDRIITAVGNAYSKVSEKGGTVPSSQTVANLATAIDSIPAGGIAPSLQTKSVTYTSNGTNTITPDAGYDGLSSVDVTVDVASGGEEMVNVSFKDTNFNRRYTIYSYDENGNLFCVIDNVQLNSTPSVFTVAKRGFVITNDYITMGGGSTDGIRFSGMTPVTDKRKERFSWGFIVTGDNPSFEVYDAS